MNKETSSRVSSIASRYLNYSVGDLRDDAGQPEDHIQTVCDEIQTLAGSALSQDETPGHEPAPQDFFTRLKLEYAQLSGMLDALSLFLGRDHPEISDDQMALLRAQHSIMLAYKYVLKLRITDIENTIRVAMEDDND